MTNTKVKAKENAYIDWLAMTFKSREWEKLTDDERRAFVDKVDVYKNVIRGTYDQRWEILNALEYMYLLGLGYKPIGWRENIEENPKF